MSKNLSPDEVCNRLFIFLAAKGVGLSKADQAEIEARVLGHRDAAARQRYERNARCFQVFELSLDDVQADGSLELKQTLARLPMDESSSRALARTMAEQAAALLARPCVVCDGNYENPEVHEPQGAAFEEYRIYRGMGDVPETLGAKFDSALGQHSMHHGTACTAVGAVADAARLMADLLQVSPSDETTRHVVFVTQHATGDIVWQCCR